MKTLHLLFGAGAIIAFAAGAYVLFAGSDRAGEDIGPGSAAVQGSRTTGGILGPSGTAQRDLGGNGEESRRALLAMEDELSSIKRDIETLKAQMHLLASRSNEGADGRPVPTAEAVGDQEVEEVDYAPAPDLGRGPKSIDAVFELEGYDYDTGWSERARDVLYEAFSSPEMAGISLLDVQCRATVCRVTVMHQDGASDEDMLRAMPLSVMETFSAFASLPPDVVGGRTTQAMYFGHGGLMD